MIAENYNQVIKNIEAACARSGRDPAEVTLISVSKTKPLGMLSEAYQAGARDFGENKVQELLEKFDELPTDIHWHMIGHLQRNKVKYIIDKVDLIHSVDSARLAAELEKEAAKRNISAKVLIEVNVAREASKYGIFPENLETFLDEIVSYKHVKVCGLMTIAPYVNDPEENRIYFKQLKKLSVDIMHKNVDNRNMSILSMGMSGDYQVAIEEGATMIRVGTGIFGERNYTK